MRLLSNLSAWLNRKQQRRAVVEECDPRIPAVDAGRAQASGEAAPAPSTLIDMVQDSVRIASVTFAAGLVWWLARSGGLLGTMLLGVPAWRHVDLLPVLAPPPDDEEDDEESRHRGGCDGPANAADDSAPAELSERKAPGISPAPPPRGMT